MAQAWSPAAHDREDQLHVGGIGILMLGNAYQNGSGQCPMSPAALQKLAPSESPEHGLGNNRNHKPAAKVVPVPGDRSEEHTSELQSLMRNSYAVFCLKKKKNQNTNTTILTQRLQTTIRPKQETDYTTTTIRNTHKQARAVHRNALANHQLLYSKRQTLPIYSIKTTSHSLLRIN